MKSVLILNDLHVGSKHALMPPKVKCTTRGNDNSANTVWASPEQRIIYHEWLKMLRTVGNVDVCILNGDLCEGTDVKGKGNDNWTNNLYQQVQTAADLIRMVKADVYYGTQGSLYHTGDNISTDEAVLRELKGKFDDDCIIEIDGVSLHVAHAVSYAQRLHTRANTIGTQLVDALTEESDFGKVDIICRAHAHYFVKVEYPSHMGFVNAGWKNRDAFGKRGKNSLTAPRLGYSFIDIEDGSYHHEKHTFHLPPEHTITRYVVE